MSHHQRCSRSWQAEAVLDRRLSADDCAAFQRHVRGCSVCARELSELSRLQALGSELPWPEAEPLQRRRARHELLRGAHAGSIDRALPARRVAWRWGLAVAALCVAAVAFRVHATRAPTPAPVVASPTFDVRPHAGSVWRQLSSGRAVRLALDSGGLQLWVGKLHSSQTFSVQLPDGELEVRGTRFVVEADGGRTSRVAVSEGRVALRISGQAELLLGAGQSWQLTAVVPGPALPDKTEPSARPQEQRRRAPPPRASSAALLAPSASASVNAAPLIKPSSAGDFAEAMATYTRGDFATAERLFERFEQQHPQSSQLQDCLFLRAMARHRRGDQAGARQLAIQYLARYPEGFRAAEARRLAGAQ